MQTWTQLSWKTFGELEAGAIARARLAGEMALILKLDNDAAGILDSPTVYSGIWFPPEKRMKCVSFGTGWFLDLVPDEELYPENPQAFEHPSLLNLDSAGLVCCFSSPPEKASDALCYSLASGEITDGLQAGAAPVNEWSIWESEQHRLAIGAKPLFKHSLPPPM